VSSARIVETLDELEDGNARLSPRPEAMPIEQLAFECGEEALAKLPVGLDAGDPTFCHTGAFSS
jgi:hypothetical protein